MARLRAAAIAALALCGGLSWTSSEACAGSAADDATRLGLLADLRVLVDDFPDPVAPGGLLTYDVLVENLGPDMATGVTLVQDLPSTLGVVIVPSQGMCGLTGNIVQCDLQSLLGGGDFATVHIELTAPAVVGTYTSTATVSAAEVDPDPTNNTSIESTEVALPEISVSDVTATEGDVGDVFVTFLVSLSQTSGDTITVDYTTVDGTATVADLDYGAVSGTLTFNPGDQGLLVDVAIHGDTKYEFDEAFTLQLSNATNATILDSDGAGGIRNDDAAPTAAVSDVSVLEGDAGTVNAVFDLTLSAAAGRPVLVDYATADGTATAGVDYVATSGVASFAPGATSLAVSVAVSGDVLSEPDETFSLQLRHNLLYAANFQSQDISAYTIDNGTGALTAVPGSPFPAGNTPLSIRLDPSGRFAYSASYGSASVSGYSVDGASGALTPLPGSPYVAGTNPVGIAVDPSGRFAYVANSTSNDVSGFAIDAAGNLVPLPGSPYPAGAAGPAFIAIDSAGRFAYVANQGSGSVSGFSIDPVTGALAPVPGSPFLAGPSTTGVAVDPAGQYAYASSGGSAEVWGYAIDPVTGALTDVPGSPFGGPLGPFVAGVTVEPSGRYVYAVGDSGPTAGYAINPDGSLSGVPGSPFLPQDNGAVTADPGGRFVYTGGSLNAEIRGYAIDDVTGDLVTLASSPFPSGSPIALHAARLVAVQGTATIVDDDAILTVSVDDVTATEGSSNATFNVTLSGPGVAPVSVGFATADGSATVADGDYIAASGSLTFAPGQTLQPVIVTVNDDAALEPNETFLVNLSSPQGAAILDGQGQGTIVNDDPAQALGSRIELVHGSSLLRSLGAVGAVAYDDYFRIRELARSSYEVVVDAVTGDIGPDGPALERIASDGTTVLQSSVPAGAGASRSLSFENSGGIAVDEFVRVRSLGCGVSCGPEDTYALRAYETTLSVARFNNSATQITVLILQNTTGRSLAGNIWLRDLAGAVVGSVALSLAPRGNQVLNTASVAPGASGTIAISHDGRYGDIAGKAVAVEPATGFTFDTPLLPRPR